MVYLIRKQGMIMVDLKSTPLPITALLTLTKSDELFKDLSTPGPVHNIDGINCSESTIVSVHNLYNAQ